MVEVVHEGGGNLVCCGQPMKLVVENTMDASKEKHIPVVEKLNPGIKVTVGSVLHPMDDKHYIEWIEIIRNGKICRKDLKPGEAPEAIFCLREGDEFSVRAYCNLHGLWKS